MELRTASRMWRYVIAVLAGAALFGLCVAFMGEGYGGDAVGTPANTERASEGSRTASVASPCSIETPRPCTCECLCALPTPIPEEGEFYLVTGYAVGDENTPGWVTVSGRSVWPGITAACPKELDFGTLLWIESLGYRICEDRGANIFDKRLDVAFHSPAMAEEFGRRWLRVKILR